MANDGLTRHSSRQQLFAALSDESAAQTLDGGDTQLGRTNRIALLLVDVDRFSSLESRFGVVAAEQVLTRIGHRMRTALRANQFLARLDGDEFAVVLPAADPEAAERVAQALLAQLEDDVEVGPFAEPGPADGTDPAETTVIDRVRVSASVGIATCRLPRGDPGSLVSQAAVAVLRAKQSGGGISHYDPDQEHATRRPPIRELRVALAQGDLEVHLQPQVDLRTRAVHGAEALARWRHPNDGVLLPASFLPLAAQTGLMRPIAKVLLDRTVQACRQWWSRGHEVPVSLNLSVSDLLDPDLTDDILQHLAKAGLPPRALRIEITEDVFLTDADVVAELLHAWQQAGVVVALDDFGTGYSSLAYLRRLPIGELKLDQVFIHDLDRTATATIVRHTVAMAHDLGMTVVAEGIEDEETARRLLELGCDFGQGILFGAAMPLQQFLAFLDLDR